MDRKIRWNSGVFDEIEMVYEKAKQNPNAARLLANLEEGALAEAQRNSRMISIDGKVIAPEEFDTLPDSSKEQLIANLAGIGLKTLSADLSIPKITICLSATIQPVLNCTAFSILNRLENLDGTVNRLFPNMELEIQAPIGGKKGLVVVEMLIAVLYPWLTVREVSSDVVAAPIEQQCTEDKAQSVNVADVPLEKEKPEKESKLGFWAKFWGKK